MIQRILVFLGPSMSRALLAWLAVTGLVSLILNAFADQADWVRPVQSLLAVAFLLGAAVIVISRLAPGDRGRWVGILLPACVALVLAVFVIPQFSGLLLGGALGWVVASLLITRARGPMEYREAIRHLRKNQYAEADKVMDQLIRSDPQNANHYKFRAEINRLWGKLKQAQRDYQHYTELAPQSPVGYNGLAEVFLQSGDYEEARRSAERAYELVPNEWVTLYNLGMIEDRLGRSAAAVEHLEQALALKVKDARHRLLIYLYLTRAYSRLDQMEAAAQSLQHMKGLVSGLEEWQTILKDEQAATLKRVIGDDVETARRLMMNELPLEALRRIANG